MPTPLAGLHELGEFGDLARKAERHSDNVLGDRRRRHLLHVGENRRSAGDPCSADTTIDAGAEHLHPERVFRCVNQLAGARADDRIGAFRGGDSLGTGSYEDHLDSRQYRLDLFPRHAHVQHYDLAGLAPARHVTQRDLALLDTGLLDEFVDVRLRERQARGADPDGYE